MKPLRQIMVLVFILAALVLSGLGIHFDEVLDWQIFEIPGLALGLKILVVLIMGVHVVRNPELDGFYKSNWIFGFIVFAFIAVPLYWYRYFWKSSWHECSEPTYEQSIK